MTVRGGIAALALLGVVLGGMTLGGCAPADSRRVVDLWHQMRPEDREILVKRIAEFERIHPEIQVRQLYKETEELRSGLVSSLLADSGPDLIYGPSDAAGLYQAMGALADMRPWLPEEKLADFDPRALLYAPPGEGSAAATPPLTFVGDRFGNHLALVYNAKFVAEPPRTTDDLVRLAKENTVDEDGDGKADRFGLVWNYTEPFFVVPFLTGYGAWVFDKTDLPVGETPQPALDTSASIAAYEFVSALRNEHGVLPPSADYEAAKALFEEGRAAMLIDGDWSWQKYLGSDRIDAHVALLPTVSSTGRPMAGTVAPKGYSLTTFAHGPAADDAMQLVDFLTSPETQRVYLQEQKILPSRLSLRSDPAVSADPVLQTSLKQADLGPAMPVCVEMRAVWDAMRPPYQLLMAGQLDAVSAAKKMQRDAVRQIELLHKRESPDGTVSVVYALAAAALGALVWRNRGALAGLAGDLRRNRLAYVFALPSIVVIFLTVLYPLVYNVVLSFSNMSLSNLRSWQVTGLQNYEAIALGSNAIGAGSFWGVLGKTLFWTVVNVSLHVALGVLLAVALNGPIRGKSLYRVLLVIPWAVPAYITSLTWRGMFDEQFGAVNQLIGWINGWLPKALEMPQLNWLGEANPAFAACIIANVWLGFPFMMMIALGGLQGIPAELYEAARIDRASRWQQFRAITLPMLKPVLIPAVTLGAVWTFNNLNVVWLVSNGGEPADKTHILVSYVYKAVFNLYQYGYGAALSMTIFAMLLAFSLVFLNRTNATEALG